MEHLMKKAMKMTRHLVHGFLLGNAICSLNETSIKEKGLEIPHFTDKKPLLDKRERNANFKLT